MTLVAANQDQYETGSVTHSDMSYARRQVAADQAKRRLRQEIDKKEKQVDQMRQVADRKRRQLEDEKEQVDKMYQMKEADEETIVKLKEQKLLYRIFKQLDVERKESLSIENFERIIGSETAVVHERLFSSLATTFHITIKTREYEEGYVEDLLIREMGLHPLTLETTLLDTHSPGLLKMQLKLVWSSHPIELEKDPKESEEENERRDEERQKYYQSMGGDGESVSVETAQMKETQMIEIIRTQLSEGWEVLKVHDEIRSDFDDFTYFWKDMEDSVIPDGLKDLYREQKQIEEETILPEEALDRVVELEHQIKHQLKLNDVITRDTALTEKDIAAVDKQIDNISKELLNIQRVTGFDSNISNKDAVDFKLQEQEIKQLMQLVKKVEEEQTKGNKLLRRKTKLIEALTSEVDEKGELEEQVFQATNDLKVANREIDELLEQTRGLKNDHSKSDKAIMVLENTRDQVAVQSLQNDKQYLRNQITHHLRSKGESDRAIKAQAHRLGVLDRRLEMVTNALKDLKKDQKIQRRLKDALVMAEDDLRDATNMDSIMPDNEMVDIELYEILNRDLEAITNSIKLKDIILIEKEASIEATELKLEELHRIKEDDEEYYYITTNKTNKV